MGQTPALYLLLQEAGEPVPFGPAVWSWQQYLGIGVYLVLFLLFVAVVYRLARPYRPSESDDETSPAS